LLSVCYPKASSAGVRETSSFQDIDATGELARRPKRPPGHAAENAALVELARHMAEAPHSILIREILEATPILESAAQTVNTLVGERKHTLTTTIDRSNLWVDADPTRVEQIVVNLLNNAAKFSENGG
jgi:signal transduction histidine kinase